jgi:lipopolysaccharide/colanic/teichoic acid biosynthesis glycosyltransferase
MQINDKNDRDKIIARFTSSRRRELIYPSGLKMIVWKSTVAFSYFLKRLLDIVVSFMAIFIASPLLIFVGIVIRIESPGSVIFSQVRVGKDGRHFKFFKFRSMIQNAEKLKAALTRDNESRDGVIFKMKKDPRITRVGAFIRKFSIDELPQLFNVLIGDMSLVGPRPPLPREVAEYTIEDRKRLHANPGITCTWQISGRSDIPFKIQVELDKEYIRSKSFWKDLRILVLTIPAVLTGHGAY